LNYTTIKYLEKLWAHIDGAYAPNTIRAYGADMAEFINYCNKHAHCALPANPLDISKFLLATMPQGVKSATIRREVASISAVHHLSNLADPTKPPEVKLCIRKINRLVGQPI
jgi:site-specific recombinase XerD